MSVPYVCTKDKPWVPSIKPPVVHPDCHEVGDQKDGWPGGDIQKYHCPNCGHTWTAELPQ